LKGIYSNLNIIKESSMVYQWNIYCLQKNYLLSEMCRDAECVNLHRIDHIREKCKDFGNQSRTEIISRTMIYDDRSKLIYCFVPKVGSTTFKYLMEKSNPKCSVNPGSVHTRAQMQHCGMDFLSRVSSIAKRNRKLQNYTSILVVRNPYGRLYSAYWQKATLIQHFRHRKSKKKNNTDPVSFDKFLTLFIKAMTTDKPKYAPIRNNWHWRSVWEICSPCSISYDYVIKLESLNREKQLLLPLFNASKLPNLNIAGGSTRRGMPKDSIPDAITAYRQISTSLLSDLTKVLQYDLDLFGYGIDLDNGLYSVG
jgi:hypothetical protein